MSAFTEDTYEQALIELFQSLEGKQFLAGHVDLGQTLTQVLIVDQRLQRLAVYTAAQTRYIGSGEVGIDVNKVLKVATEDSIVRSGLGGEFFRCFSLQIGAIDGRTQRTILLSLIAEGSCAGIITVELGDFMRMIGDLLHQLTREGVPIELTRA